MENTCRIYIQKDGTVSSVCPHCGMSRLFTINEIGSAAAAVDVQCTCGKHYPFLAELRKAYRRTTNLPGVYRKTSSDGERGEILITNMSMTGIGFTPLGKHSMTQGDRLFLQFALTDKDHTSMEVVVTVVHASENRIGCAFEALSPQQEDALASFFVDIL